eukprot:3681539-Amphidinium_carterae.2
MENSLETEKKMWCGTETNENVVKWSDTDLPRRQIHSIRLLDYDHSMTRLRVRGVLILRPRELSDHQQILVRRVVLGMMENPFYVLVFVSSSGKEDMC